MKFPCDGVAGPSSVVQVGPGSCGPLHCSFDKPDELATTAESLPGTDVAGSDKRLRE